MELIHFGLSITFEDLNNKLNRNSQQKKIFIALAGPFVNLLFIILSLIIPMWNYNEMIFYSNIILLIVNLLPIYPLDGRKNN